jgi:hypothetical protein
MHTERGNTHWVVIIVGILIILFLVGFFRSDRSFFDKINYKAVLNLPCDITVDSPKAKERILLPLTVKGFINGCGWEMGQANAGTAQIFDGKGLPVSAATPLSYTDDSSELPRPYKATLVPIAPPTVDTGTIVFTSTTGLIHAIPISF